MSGGVSDETVTALWAIQYSQAPMCPSCLDVASAEGVDPDCMTCALASVRTLVEALRANPGLAAEALGGELGTEVSVRSADGVTSQRHVIRLPWGSAS